MKRVKLFEQFIAEEATTSWSKMMKGVKAGGSGPWSLVAIENKKVVAQRIDIKTKEMLPAEFEALRRENPKAKIHIEDAGGMVVWNESVANETYKPVPGDVKVAGIYDVRIAKSIAVRVKVAGFERQDDTNDALYLMDTDKMKPVVGSFIVKNSDMRKLEKGTQITCKTSKGDDAKITRIGDL